MKAYSLPTKLMLTLGAIALFGSAAALVSANSEVNVYGDTSAGENQPGWLFNRDTDTDTPFEFNTDEASIGDGALYVLPITNTEDGNADKFIAELFPGTLEIADTTALSYDFLIGSGGDASDENQFYLNVYANFGETDDNNFFDCRYNVVPTTGSTTDWTTVTFDPTQSYPVTTRGSSPYTCPNVPADMDLSSPSSTIRVFAINVGDTSASDQGLDGYLDNVVLDAAGEVTTYDFEPFMRSAEITNPDAGETVSGVVDFTATLNDLDGNDGVQWAVRAGTCAAGTGTVYGNVDGKSTSFDWDGADFSASIDMSADTPGDYCFVFNPGEDAGDAPIRLTREFVLEAPAPTDPTTKDECKKGGWTDFGFKNQGQCVRFVETGKDSR